MARVQPVESKVHGMRRLRVVSDFSDGSALCNEGDFVLPFSYLVWGMRSMVNCIRLRVNT